MKITAALARSPGADFEIGPVELDEPRQDEIRVRIAAVGRVPHRHRRPRGRHALQPCPPCSATRAPAWSMRSARQ